jgi:hypothetical protein
MCNYCHRHISIHCWVKHLLSEEHEAKMTEERMIPHESFPIYTSEDERPVPPDAIPKHFQSELAVMSELAGWECVVCTEPMSAERFHLTPCFHKVCTQCIVQLIDSRCPVCRVKL